MKIKQLFCTHEYVYNGTIKIPTKPYPHMREYVNQYKCTKCGKLVTFR